MTNPDFLEKAYGTTDLLTIRIRAQERYGINPHDLFDSMTQWALSRSQARSALDVGMGTGKWYQSLRRLSGPKIQYRGIDAALAMVTEMSERTAHDDYAAVTLGDAQMLPYEDDQFDWVGLHFMLYHVPNPEKALQEAWRVVRPGGLIITLAHGQDTLENLWALHQEAVQHCLKRSIQSDPQPSYTLDNGAVLFNSPNQVFQVRYPSGLRFPNTEAALAYYASGFWQRGLQTKEWEDPAILSCLLGHVENAINRHIAQHGTFDIPGTTGWLWAIKS